MQLLPYLTDEEADPELNWRQWMAEGIDKLQWGRIFVPSEQLTVQEWEA